MGKNKKDRAKGALMGAFVGEALGVGPHWYYDLEEMHKEYGNWIDDYTEPKDDRYHAGLEAGEISQSGILLKMMAQHLIENKGYNQDAFCKMMDQDFLPKISGEAMAGPGGYTSQSMRHLWRARVEKKLPWDQVAGNADTTEAIERNIAQAIFYSDDLESLSLKITANTALTQSDNLIGSLTVAYSSVLALLIQGESLDSEISTKLMQAVDQGKLPFHKVTSDNLNPPAKNNAVKESDLYGEGLFASPDGLLSPSYMARAAADEDIVIEPAWKAAVVYGMPCAIYHMLPAVYYLSARFKDDFEAGVLHALNGGGQNQVRTMLTGALIGAQLGFSEIPKRFIEGLKQKEELLTLSDKLAEYL
ncbi:MAG: ADP-ribosylglycohydrolase family protein [Bacillota bacterium]